MKSRLILLILILLLSCKTVPNQYDLIINNISIIDVINPTILENQTILIKGKSIVKIVNADQNLKSEADAILDGTGKYMIPGFWDMHLHITWKENLDKQLFPTLLSYGITGVRDMGGNADILNSFKESSSNNPYLSPELYGPGPILDGENPIHPAFSAALTSSNVREVLDSLNSSDVDFFKVYSLLPDDVLDSISVYSKEKKIPFSGHISEYITPENASELGQKSFEHLNRLEELSNDSERVTRFAQLVKSNGNWLCPTLLIYQRQFEIANNEFFYHPLFEELDSDLKFEWEQVRSASETNSQDETDLLKSKNKLESRKTLVKSFYDNGIPLLIGTDFAGMQFIYPGYSLHEEMSLLQSIGIPAFEILKMATYNPALFLGIQDQYGTIEEGKTADLVILNANPVENIENTLEIVEVIKAGKVVETNN